VSLWPFRHARPMRYRLDRSIRYLIMRSIGWLAPSVENVDLDPGSSSIKKILLVRANFRMGNAVLALPAIAVFRHQFPDARIDFVGSPISRLLFSHQRLDHHYVAPRRFPRVVWQYPRLLRKLRARRYDLAVDVSCSHSGIASFIVGFSGARIRAGIAGKWDQLFNRKIAKLAEENKYRKMTELLVAMHLETGDAVASMQFSTAEKIAAAAMLKSAVGQCDGPAVGIFIGARKLRGKRWPLENFISVTNGLRHRGVAVVVFLGPEESDLTESLRTSLDPAIPVICEPEVRKFAATVAQLDLFICCDSGPMHLACAVGVRVLAIFQENDVSRWAPPPSMARIVVDADGVSPFMVLQAALEELFPDDAASDSPTGLSNAAQG
jgi:ADP-heptose:LPS heptosyltransferase